MFFLAIFNQQLANQYQYQKLKSKWILKLKKLIYCCMNFER